MRGLTPDERMLLVISHPGQPDAYIDDFGIPDGVEMTLQHRGLLACTGRDEHGIVYETTCLGSLALRCCTVTAVIRSATKEET